MSARFHGGVRWLSLATEALGPAICFLIPLRGISSVLFGWPVSRDRLTRGAVSSRGWLLVSFALIGLPTALVSPATAILVRGRALPLWSPPLGFLAFLLELLPAMLLAMFPRRFLSFARKVRPASRPTVRARVVRLGRQIRKARDVFRAAFSPGARRALREQFRRHDPS